MPQGLISSCLRVILGINGQVLVAEGCSGADAGGGWEALVVAALKSPIFTLGEPTRCRRCGAGARSPSCAPLSPVTPVFIQREFTATELQPPIQGILGSPSTSRWVGGTYWVPAALLLHPTGVSAGSRGGSTPPLLFALHRCSCHPAPLILVFLTSEFAAEAGQILLKMCFFSHLPFLS